MRTGVSPVLYRNFNGAPIHDTFYPAALAEHLCVQERLSLCPSPVRHMYLWINSDINWYLERDGMPAPEEMDLVSAVIHEVGHGIGLISSVKMMAAPNGEYIAKFGVEQVPQDYKTPYPFVFDTLLRTTDKDDKKIQNVLDMHDGSSYARAVTDDNLWAELDSDSGLLVKLFAPSIFAEGSSASHLHENYVYTGVVGTTSNDALMTPISMIGVAIHDPGPITLCLLSSMGWSVGHDCTKMTAADVDPLRRLSASKALECAEADQRLNCATEHCCYAGAATTLRQLVQRSLCASTCCGVLCELGPKATPISVPSPPLRHSSSQSSSHRSCHISTGRFDAAELDILHAESAEACGDLCLNADVCQAFTYRHNSGSCYLQGSDALDYHIMDFDGATVGNCTQIIKVASSEPLTVSTTMAPLITKHLTANPIVEQSTPLTSTLTQMMGCRLVTGDYSGYNIFGNESSTVVSEVDQCSSKCISNSACDLFTFVYSSGRCHLKSAAGIHNYIPDRTSMTSGDCTGSTALTIVSRRPSIPRWEWIAQLPTILKEAEGLTVAEKLWVFGGFQGGGFEKMGRLTLAYNPGSNRWDQYADVPVNGGISHTGQATDGQNIYLTGGMQVRMRRLRMVRFDRQSLVIDTAS